LNINAAGFYTFQTSSDDGSLLYLDGQPIAQNDVSQGITTRGGGIDLTPGAHTIIVKYSNGAGGAAMIANYSGPDTGAATVAIGSVAGTLTNNGSTIFGTTAINNNISLVAG